MIKFVYGKFVYLKYICIKGSEISLLSNTPIFAQAKVSKLLQDNRYNFNIVIKIHMHAY